jgi:hypothetical protein
MQEVEKLKGDLSVLKENGKYNCQMARSRQPTGVLIIVV